MVKQINEYISIDVPSQQDITESIGDKITFDKKMKRGKYSSASRRIKKYIFIGLVLLVGILAIMVFINHNIDVGQQQAEAYYAYLHGHESLLTLNHK